MNPWMMISASLGGATLLASIFYFRAVKKYRRRIRGMQETEEDLRFELAVMDNDEEALSKWL